MKQVRLKLAKLFHLLNERQRRILAAAEAKNLGRGGIVLVAKVTGMSRQTIYQGIAELGDTSQPDRARKSGGGRKKINQSIPDLVVVLQEIIESTTRGDPESPLRWTCKSVRNIAACLFEKGYKISHQAVANLLHELDYSLQANSKSFEGQISNPDRDAQFKYINEHAESFLKSNNPVISVDTKKKELVGRYKNAGKEWGKKGKPVEVLSHDFPDPKVPKAVPYGVYDIGRNQGWVNLGIDADTAEFAVESIKQWWIHMGKPKYKKISHLLICADSGGSNGYRVHLWKYELQKFCDSARISITVLHYPPGTSKWNKIEHRLFSFITMNWRGKPLIDYRTIVDLIASTKTRSGLRVKVRLDENKYKRKIKVPKEEMQKLLITRHDFHGEWNYTIEPRNV